MLSCAVFRAAKGEKFPLKLPLREKYLMLRSYM